MAIADSLSMLTVSLNNLQFFSKHGLYAEEVKVGGEFVVNLSVSYLPSKDVIDDIDETINYVTLYNIVKAKMDTPTPLLETIAMHIAKEVVTAFPQIKKIVISIQKTTPPITGFIGNTSVCFEKEY